MSQNSTPIELGANHVLSLDVPGGKWEIESGSLALFLCEFEREDSRTPLLTIGPGDLLPAAPRIKNAKFGLKAVALENCRLQFFDADATRQLLAEDSENQSRRYLELVDRICEALPLREEALSDVSWPADSTEHKLELKSGQTFRAPRSSHWWAGVESGEVLFCGLPDAVIDKGFAAFPAVSRFWLVAKTDTVIQIQSAMPVEDLEKKRVLVMYFPGYLEDLANRASDVMRARFRKREKQVANRLRSSVERIAQILDSKISAIPEDWPALAKACAIIGRHQGITFKAPRAFDQIMGEDAVLALAQASCVRVRKITLDGNWQEESAMPLLVFRRGKSELEPLALIPLQNGGYECHDPESGEFTRMKPEDGSTLQPYAYVFYTPLPAGAITARSLLGLIWQNSRRSVIAIAMYGLLVSVLSLAIPEASRQLIENALPTSDSRLVVQIGLGLIVVVISIGLFALAQGYATSRLACQIDHTVQSGLIDRVFRLSTQFFRRYSAGDLVLRVMAMQQIQVLVSTAAVRTILGGLVSISTLVVLFSYNATLALAATCIGVASYLVTIYFCRHIYAVGGTLLETRGQNFGLVIELLGGINKLRVAGAERRAFAYWTERYASEKELSLKQRAYQDHMELTMRALSTASVIVLLILGTPLLGEQSSRMSTGEFIAFYFAFGQFMAGVSGICDHAQALTAALNLWQRARPIVSEEPESSAVATDPGVLRGTIEVDRVSFRYTKKGPLVLDNVSISAQPGQYIAIVGPSGCGKSTLLRLLLGFDRPGSGIVYYDNQDLGGLDLGALRRQIGVVLQNGRISGGSIFENIQAGGILTREEALDAARLAAFDKDIEHFPMGLHTVVSEGGGTLSGGQRQRLLIARALAHKPKIIFMDEATSALDNQTQRVVAESMERLKVTRVVIAHRLSTIRNADYIYVMEKGRVVQNGTFNDLKSAEGLFKRLIERQIV